jgi:hypothetical protein
MAMARVIFTAMALTAAGVMTMTSAEARHYRHTHAYSDYAVDASTCGPIPPPISQNIYPEANWEPFFRHHAYRYGPILACALVPASSNVISVRY